ncbi:hypothetical protein AZE42_09009 [Rhizopogon vesiculosus]|uniref:Ricin B lectin domain-containing protein n=1 Tax=Rhizopogon vesiculosus TaxID=180088 RepID=A0A1J8R5R9_9AGAM|nr:hypothetical protein AZE42_09009 [Rhizopogon vesiculosus]
MSDYPLAPKNYTIENTWWKKQLVSVGGENAIVGRQRLIGGTQTWKLEYNKNGYATFQGVPPYPTDGKYIAVGQDGRDLVYSETPGLFQLEGTGVGENIFVVRPAGIGEDAQPLVGWRLQSGEDGSPVIIANVMIEGAQWKFS